MNQLALIDAPAGRSLRRTYGRLRYLAGSRRWCFFEVEPHVVMRLKDVFKRIPRGAAGELYLSDGPDTCADILWFLSRYPLALEEADRERLDRGAEEFDLRRADIERILLPDWQPPSFIGFRDGIQPYPFQAQAVEVTQRLRRLLLLDDVGLGKTVSALGVMMDSDVLPAAVVVQAHLADQWKDDYIEAFTSLSVHIIKGTRPYDLPKADVYIFKYSNVAGWADIASRGVFRSVFFDEIQELRAGTATQKGRAARVFCDATNLRMGLTATPVYNYGEEIFRVIEFIAPGALGSWYEFLMEWCTPGPGAKWKVKDPDALGSYLRELQITLRRTEDDVGGQMPPVNTVIANVPYDEDIAAAAEEHARVLAMKVLNGSFTERGQAARELDMFARHTTGVAKAKHVADFVRVLLEADRPILLGGWHRDVYDIWMERLAAFKPVLYTGSENARQKRTSKEEFLSGRSNLMIMSLRSGAGVDGLQRRCSTAVFGELDWSPQVHKQFVGRLRRPGQTGQVDAIYLVADGGSDPPMVAVNGVKASQARGIVDPFKGTETTHSDISRIQALARAFLEKGGAGAQTP